MENDRTGRAYISPYLLQPIRTLADVSAELARKTAEAVRPPGQEDGGEDEARTAADRDRIH